MVTRIVQAHRSKLLPKDGGRTLFFKLDIGRLGLFIRPENMPPFDGDDGWVETLGPATAIQVLRQVEPGTRSREATVAERKAVYLRTRKAKPSATPKSPW